jgi:hypothetical protein
MHVEIWQGETRYPVELGPGELQVGGGPGDGLKLDGLAPGALTLEVEGERLTVTAREALRVSGVMLLPEVPRRLLPGDTIALAPRVQLRRPLVERYSPGTASVARGLLAEGGFPLHSRAAALLCLSGLEIDQRFPLAGERVEVGRAPEAQVRLRDRAVSRRHARLHRLPEGFVLEPLPSPNRLYLNGQPMTERRLLQEGDLLELGQTLLRYSAPWGDPPVPLAVKSRPWWHLDPWVALVLGSCGALLGLTWALRGWVRG